jgi:AraC family transcriptional regulator
MQPRIEYLSEKRLIGKRMMMSFANHNPYQLWSSFMPGRKAIQNNIGLELYSVEVYPPLFFENYNPDNEFEKWAAVEVKDFNIVPDGMETLIFPAGMYAVFIHKGSSAEAATTYNCIFQTWLPASDYLLDNRPHFAVMGEKYKRDDADSEEEIWIPVRKK